MIELWTRPWALAVSQHRHQLTPGDHVAPAKHTTALWLYTDTGEPIRVNGRIDIAEPVVTFGVTPRPQTLTLLPLSLRRSPGTVVAIHGGEVRIQWHSAPERPSRNNDISSIEDAAARSLLLRTETVWDRLSDVEAALVDPLHFWDELRRRWIQDKDFDEPLMDVVVRHARKLTRVLEELDRKPRRILRRTHRMVPLSRVQEMDRRALTWLIRQPGSNLVERAGNTQRMLAVARQQNFDTLENRVLRAYAELALSEVRDYLDRNERKHATRRFKLVADFGQRCRRLARDLGDRGVRYADPAVTPNFVLLQNPQYHQVWGAWQELLQRKDAEDDLWRWQVRSWEDFVALAVVLALQEISGARLVAAAPIIILSEQRRGSWFEHDNPFAVLHLPASALIVELHLRADRVVPEYRELAAPVWISFGFLHDIAENRKIIPLWPMWDVSGGISLDEVGEISSLISAKLADKVAGGLIIRPAPLGSASDLHQAGNVIAVSLGTQGETLRDGISYLTVCLSEIFRRGVS